MPINLRPRSANVLPSADISKLLSAGPTACDAALAFFNAIRIADTCPVASVTQTRASGSRRPNGVLPLNSLLARPSQKLRKLKAELIVVGALRGSTLRV